MDNNITLAKVLTNFQPKWLKPKGLIAEKLESVDFCSLSFDQTELHS